MRGLFAFPNPVNDLAARTVAAVVLSLTVLTLVLGVVVGHAWLWLTVVLAYGFLARVLTGPSLSPLAYVAMAVVAPRLGEARPVPGPPKRFAQGIGAVVTLTALGFLAGGFPVVTEALLGVLVIAAGLEALAGYCLGCRAFAVLMSIGVIPASACEACANVSLRADSPLPAR